MPQVVRDVWALRGKVFGVYFIRNTTNGKTYVGSTARLGIKRRCRHHRSLLRGDCHTNNHLQKAWNKYGESSFKFLLVEGCLPEKCLEREQHWIDFCKSADRGHGYNLAPMAGNSLGVKIGPHTEEWKAQQRKWNRQNLEKVKADLALGRKNRWAKTDAKEKHLKQLKRMWSNPELVKRMSEARKKMWEDDEYRLKMSHDRKAQWQREDCRERTINNMRATAATPEERARKSAAMKSSWQDKAYREKMRARSEKVKKLWADPEWKSRVGKKISDTKRAKSK